MTPSSPGELRRLLLERAAALVPTLRERAAATERARQILPETLDDLWRLGLLGYRTTEVAGKSRLTVPVALCLRCLLCLFWFRVFFLVKIVR